MWKIAIAFILFLIEKCISFLHVHFGSLKRNDAAGSFFLIHFWSLSLFLCVYFVIFIVIYAFVCRKQFMLPTN